MPTLVGETYLGDSVYVSFDGFQIKLRTGDIPPQTVHLNPVVYEALTRFVEGPGEKDDRA